MINRFHIWTDDHLKSCEKVKLIPKNQKMLNYKCLVVDLDFWMFIMPFRLLLISISNSAKYCFA